MKLDPSSCFRVENPLGLNVGVPGLTSLVISMTDAVALKRTLIRNLAPSRHGFKSPSQSSEHNK